MEYVPYGSADGNEAVGSALSDLASGQVDLMGPLLKNAATEEMFEFTENSYGTVYTTLVALAAGSLRENNLRDRDVLRVGLWQTAETRNGEVLTYLKSENLPYEIVYYDTAAEQQQALLLRLHQGKRGADRPTGRDHPAHRPGGAQFAGQSL